MKRLTTIAIVLAFFALCCIPAHAQNECATSALGWAKARATGSDQVTHDIECVNYVNARYSLPWFSTLTPLTLDKVQFADQFAGADACAKINAAIAVLPSTGGTVDARGFEGAQTCATNPFTGVTKKVRLLVGHATVATTTVGWTLPSGSTIEGPAAEIFTIIYTGTGTALDASGASDCELKGVAITTTNDAATALKMGTQSQHCKLDRVFLTGTNTATNTGTGLLLDAGPSGAFSGHLDMNLLYVLGYKFGVRFVGVAVGSTTWTTATCTNCFILGRSAGIVAASAGISMDANTNCTACIFDGGALESFATGYLSANGGSTGVQIRMDIEGNTTPFTVGASFNGTIHNTAAVGGSYFTTEDHNFYQTFVDASNYRNYFISKNITGGIGGVGVDSAGSAANGSFAVYVGAGTGNLWLYTNGLQRWAVNGNGVLAAAADLTYDIGVNATSNRPRNIYAGGISLGTSVLSDGGMKHQRVTTGSCATTGCSVTLTWTAAFADANYSVSCSLEDSTAQSETTGLRLGHITSKAAGSVVMTLDNFSGAGVTGTLDCIAMHD